MARGLPAHRSPRRSSPPTRRSRWCRCRWRCSTRSGSLSAASSSGARRSPSLNVLLTSTCWRNDHNGFSHQGPGFIDTMLSHAGSRRPRLPAARRELPAVGRRPLPPQQRLRQLHRDRQAAAAAVARPRRGAGALRSRRVTLGRGRATTTTTVTPTSSSRARATSRRSRRSRRRGSSESSCPT